MVGGNHDAASAPRIFISYRRDDAAGHAGRLYDQLVSRWPGAHVFMDTDAIPSGTDFVELTEGALGDCDVLLVLIGRQWSTIRGPDGRRRLDEPDDLVRREVEGAFGRDIPVIPILLQGARMPTRAELPASIAALARRQAHEIFDTGWRAGVDALVQRLETLLGVKSAEGSRPPATPGREPDSGGMSRPPEGPRTRPRRRRAWLAGGAAMVVVAAVVVVIVARQDDRLACTDDGRPPTAVAPGLLTNPSFESDTEGWGPYSSTLQRVRCGSGSGNAHAVRVTWAVEKDVDFTVGSFPDPAPVPMAGCRYQAEAYVSAASSSSLGKTARLYIREGTEGKDGGMVDQDHGQAVVLTPEFQEVTVTYSATGSGTVVDTYLTQEAAGAGDSFYADDFVLTASEGCAP